MKRKSIFQFLALLILIGMYGCQNKEEIKREQYFSEGYQLFTTHCANCHQADGKGMTDLYPPLQGSQFLGSKNELICITKLGLSGEIKVNGKIYNRPMPANTKLSNIEIAEIVTYISNSWGNEKTYTPIDTVTQALNRCEGNSFP